MGGVLRIDYFVPYVTSSPSFRHRACPALVAYPATGLLNAAPMRSMLSAVSMRAIVSKVIFELPLSRFETYCWLHPIRSASTDWVTPCLSIACIVFIVMNLAYFSHFSFSLLHSADFLHFEGVADW